MLMMPKIKYIYKGLNFMKKKIIGLLLSTSMVAAVLVTGCGKTQYEGKVVDSTTEAITTEAPTTEEPTTEEITTEEITTEEPTTEAPTPEETTEAFVSVYSLLLAEPLNPTKSGNAELDGLIDAVLEKVTTPDMNNYAKVWNAYLYLVDNITYSRGMDAHTGEYSVSDKATTPTDILWATDLLNSGQGCCYNYSAAFTYIMRAIGYDAHLVTGNVPAYAGGVTPHCWMYVNLGGIKYSFDPDLDMNWFTRGDSETKDVWFGRKLDELGYFYQAENYY